MRRHARFHALMTARRLAATAVLAWLLWPAALMAQPALGTFVPYPDAKPADGKDTGTAKPVAGLGQRNEREIGPGEQLSFGQQEVAAEMADLENRMFRLSEGLKTLEPENSSRLLLGLKYAREEYILHQMKEIMDELAKLSLRGAITEQQQLLTKLEKLQRLLLSDDLDFEMKLERLRQIREVLAKLETVIREESREEKLSRAAAEKERELAELKKRRATVDELIERQTKHIADAQPLGGKQTLAEADESAARTLGKAQSQTAGDTRDLADTGPQDGGPGHLSKAAGNMKSAAESLAKPEVTAAIPEMEQALAQLQQEKEAILRREAELQASLPKEQFAAMRKDQEGNRRTTNDVAEATRGLGTNGTAALAELNQAGSCMGGAEGAFGDCDACGGNGEQDRALTSLKYAQKLLAEEAERLARQVRGEVKRRVVAGLTKLLEEQVAVRKQTETLAPGVAMAARQALAGVTALANREEKIAETLQELVNLVEETEFGITLPAALAAVRDSAEVVSQSLADGDASNEVVSAEKRIEADLAELIAIVKEMTDLGNSGRGRRGNRGEEDESKERDRIITELRLIRMLELHVRDNTIDVDGKRAGATASAPIRKRIEDLEGRQDDIRDATERLALERGDEVPTDE